MDKIFPSADEAVADRSSIAVGGFGLAGIPAFLIEALLAHGATDLTIVSNNCGVDGAGPGLLLAEHGSAERSARTWARTASSLGSSSRARSSSSSRLKERRPNGCAPAGPASRRSTPPPASNTGGGRPALAVRAGREHCDGLASEGHPCVRWPRVRAGAGRPKRSVPACSHRCDARPETSRRGRAIALREPILQLFQQFEHYGP